ncbi:MULTISPECIES: hypothetical protein [Streptomyces althioticus group]|uniref:hypothetical protein n=1 Tax=Streptomyces althioticus group TaxID=2867194 RepID=UPI00351829BE|nr:hypothetical protein OG968_22675 [Streptomyces althioticus]WTB99118.1 hypothetical protein OHA53_12935 [Streptomyces althioticus]
MRALPARRIALGALCAALLVTTTGPAALAAGSHPGQDPAASLVARLPQTETTRTDLTPVTDLVHAVLTAPAGQLPLTEVQRLAEAAREAVTGAAADDPSSTDTSVTPAAPALPGATTPATGVLLPTTEEADGTAAEDLSEVREALDAFLDLLLPQSDSADAGSASTGTAESTGTATTETDATSTTDTTESADGVTADESVDAALTSADALLARVDELLAALAGTDEPTVTTLPAPAAPAASTGTATPAGPAAAPGLLPALTSLLTPNS